MTLATINRGSSANDGTGDDLRAGAAKINALIDFINDRGLDGETAFPLKPTARAATTANITLSGAQTIDGVACVAGDRVLVKNQSAPADNGVYVVASGAWTRAADASTWDEIHGSFVIVEEGSTNADTRWQCTTNDGGTLGSTAITFAIAGVSSITATIWGYLAGITAFIGGLLASVNLAGFITNLGGAAAVKAALSLAFSDLSGSATVAQMGNTTYTALGFGYAAVGVNFNAGNTDTAIPITLPSGFTRYRVVGVVIDGASQTLTTATCGLFTAAGAGGVAIVASGSAITVSTASENTNNNQMVLALVNSNTTSFNAATLYFRVQTPQGAAATANVVVQVQALP